MSGFFPFPFSVFRFPLPPILVLNKKLIFNLEPTFRCNLGCEMCPRFSSDDAHLDMPMATYQRICEGMQHAHTVDYTGWGEPLLHRGIYDMVRMAKGRGCATTMTSNGTALSEANSRRLIDAGLDRLTVSIDGLSPQTYDAIRIGASLVKVESHLRRLARLIAESGSSLELGIAFTIQEVNAHEVSSSADWTASVGARVLHLKQLNVPSNAEDWQRGLLKYRLQPVQRNGNRLAAVEDAIQAALDRASELGLKSHLHSQLPLTPEMQPRYCLAAPLDTVYFSFEGRVAPCCHFGHHVSRYFEGRFYPPSALFFGDIRSSSFEEIWKSPPFATFRRGFEASDYPAQCRTCYLLYGK